MKLFFIRHGESESNVVDTYDDGSSPLTPFGKKQSQMVAKRVSKLPVDIILCSDFVRTKQTAEYIKNLIDRPIVFTPLLREYQRPKEVWDKKIGSPDVQLVINQVIKHSTDPDWHYSNEENFIEFKQRARDFISYVSKRPEEHILVVSHGAFMRMVVLTMLLGEKVDYSLFQRCWMFFRTNNTGVTIFETSGDDWRLVTWNDHAHLAE